MKPDEVRTERTLIVSDRHIRETPIDRLNGSILVRLIQPAAQARMKN